MKPFLIQCESCHAGLKVTKASLLGKRLPCPKCQSLVLVPENPELADAHEKTAIQLQQGVSTAPPDESLGSFEDVDNLLSQLPADPKRRPKPRPNPQPNTVRETTNSSGTTPEPIDSALSWDNPTAAKTRRILALAAALIGVIMLVAIGSYAWFNHSSSADPVGDAALTETDSTETPPLETTAAQNTNPSPTENDAPSSEVATNEMPIDVTGSNLIEAPEAMANERPIVSSTPPPIDVPPPTAGSKPGNGLRVTSPVAQPEPATPNTPTATTGKPTTTTPSSNDPILRPVAQASSSLGELASLLEESGSSISAITDATATAAAANTIGLPKYYFQTSRSAPVNIERQLNQPCAGLRYDNVSMIEILRDITVISGIPISIDSASLTTLDDLDENNTNEKRLIPNVSVAVAHITFGEAIELIAQRAGWTSIVNETGVLLTQPNAAQTSPKTIDLTPIAELGDQGLNGVIDSIKAMIAPDSWFSDAKHFQIERNGMTLTVRHEPAVVKQVERFINKISAAIQLSSPSVANKADLEAFLKTRLSRAAENLTASCELEIGSRATLDDLLNRIRKKSNVDIIANWQTLSALEWTPQMTVPGNISEPNLDKMLRQLERSSDSTAIVLDAHTIELTHPLDAINRNHVEFYRIPDLFERNFTPQRAIQLVQEAIENAGQPTGLTIYEPKCQCIILAAPQSTHRVVEAVLLEIRQLD